MAPSKRANVKWDNSNGADDFLQLTKPDGSVPGWIDSTGAPQGTLATGGSLVAGAGISILGSVISSQTAANVVYAKQSGVKADGQFVSDAVTTNGSKTVTSATANFTQADVGKIVFGIKTAAATSPPQGVITAVNSATSIQVSIAATATSSAVTLGWGTDDTAACNTAWLAAVAAQSYLVLPSGYIFVQTSLFNITTLQSSTLKKGLGLMSDGASILVPTPLFDFSTAPSPTSGLFANWGAGNANMFPNFFYLANISVYGAGFNSGAAGVNNSIFAIQQAVVYNMQLWFWIGPGIGITFNAPAYAFWTAVDGAGTTGMLIQGGQTVDFYSCYSLGTKNVAIAAGATLNSFGSQWGQSSSNPSVSISATGTFNSYGEQYAGGNGGANARTFDVAGVLNLNGAQIQNAFNQYGINVTAGGRAFVSNTTFNLAGVSPQAVLALIAPTGIYVDDGTNTVLAGNLPGAVAANITPNTNWGTSGVAGNGVSAVSGDNRRFQFTITAAGSPTANPTIAISFPWLLARSPIFICKQVGGTGAIAQVSGENSASTSSMTLTWNGTPQAGSTYIFDCIGL